MRIVPRLVMIAAVLTLSVFAVSPVSAARAPAYNDLNLSLTRIAWPPPPYGWPPPSGCYAYYQVQWGNSLSGIAAYYGTTVGALMATNPSIWNPNVIYAGQVLCIPYPTYTLYPTYPVYPAHPMYPGPPTYPVYPMNPIYPGNPAPTPY